MKRIIAAVCLFMSTAVNAFDEPLVFGYDFQVREVFLKYHVSKGVTPMETCAIAAEVFEMNCIVKDDKWFILSKGSIREMSLYQEVPIQD